MKEYEGMTAILYARVSTDDKGQTVTQQIGIMKEWCEQKGCTIVGIYSDEESGGSLDRSQFKTVLGTIALGGINILLAWSESRLSRSTEDMQTILNICKAAHTVVRYVGSSVKPEDTSGNTLNTIMTAIAQAERDNIRKNTKLKMDMLKNNGKYLGRPLSMVWSDQLDDYNTDLNPPIRYRDMVADGKTKILSESVIIEMSYTTSVPQMAKMVGVSDTTLRNALRKRGILDTVNGNYSKKVVGKKRVGTTPIGCETRDVALNPNQASPLLEDTTLYSENNGRKTVSSLITNIIEEKSMDSQTSDCSTNKEVVE